MPPPCTAHYAAAALANSQGPDIKRTTWWSAADGVTAAVIDCCSLMGSVVSMKAPSVRGGFAATLVVLAHS